MNIINRISNKFFVKTNTVARKIFIVPKLRRRLKNMKYDFSILSNNCQGSLFLHDLGLPFNSPFVNLWLYPKDFIKYVKNIDHYKNCELEFVKVSQFNYPVAKLDDIYIYMRHYTSEKEAKEKWIQRTKRINLNKLVLVLTVRNDCDISKLKEFENFPYPKIILSYYPLDDTIKHVFYIPGLENDQNSFFTDFVKHQILGKKYYDNFDFVDFINKSIHE